MSYIIYISLCSAKRLISANIEIPTTVELLDLSYNDITTIDDDSFKVSHQMEKISDTNVFVFHDFLDTYTA